jgi:sugar phosphate isomerase/epimerase
MSTALVGYSGFVGSNLLQFYNYDYFYNSKNFHEATNKTFDTIFFCGVPAVKWLANKNPQEDIEIIHKIMNILNTVVVRKIILISTIDVYDENTNSEKNEDYDCNCNLSSHYGRNRYLFEEYIKKTFTDYHIIRLPALFGKGLKKNIIYDLIHNNQTQNIPIHSSFQWYDLNWLKKDIDLVIENKIKLCNLFTEPLQTLDIISLFTYNNEKFDHNKKLSYNLKTKYSSLFQSNIDGYIRSKEEVLVSIQYFLDFIKIKKQHLCVSNICVKKTSQIQFACLLKLYGIKNIQIAPTTLIENWSKLSDLDLSIYKNNGLNVYSFQSITFTLNEWNIFNENKDKLKEHLFKVIDCAVKNEVKVLVFGCPRNRYVNNRDDTEKNNSIFIDFFKEIGNYANNKEITLCIEPNSKKYNCNYINKIKEAGELVKSIDHDNIKMMVDIGNAIMEDDDLQDIYHYKEYIYNIDVANENMLPFTKFTSEHIEFKKILGDIQYNKNINLEMMIKEEEKELEILCLSLEKFINIFGN